jgi:hypothetical protein
LARAKAVDLGELAPKGHVLSLAIQAGVLGSQLKHDAPAQVRSARRERDRALNLAQQRRQVGREMLKERIELPRNVLGLVPRWLGLQEFERLFDARELREG